MRLFFLLVSILLWLSMKGQDSLMIDTERPQHWNQDQPIQVGTVIRSKKAGQITHIKFYKMAIGTQTYTTRIWSSGGTKLVEKTYVNNDTGWQRVAITPYTIAANTSYIVSVYSNTGKYVSVNKYFATERSRGNIVGPASTASSGNGRYAYSATLFPALSFDQCNYFVDVVFKDPTAPTEPRNPLIVNALPDTMTEYFIPVDSQYVHNVRLNGIVTGDEVTFSWKRIPTPGLEHILYNDTLLFANTLRPAVHRLQEGSATFVLTGRDKWGAVATDTLTIFININPKTTMFRLFYDGTWKFEGSTRKGFDPEPIEEPQNPL